MGAEKEKKEIKKRVYKNLGDDGKPLVGFKAMKPEDQRELARKGGKAVQAKGTGHQWTSDEARIAGSLGGSARNHEGRL